VIKHNQHLTVLATTRGFLNEQKRQILFELKVLKPLILSSFLKTLKTNCWSSGKVGRENVSVMFSLKAETH
jgi:hypothetical protein